MPQHFLVCTSLVSSVIKPNHSKVFILSRAKRRRSKQCCLEIVEWRWRDKGFPWWFSVVFQKNHDVLFIHYKYSGGLESMKSGREGCSRFKVMKLKYYRPECFWTIIEIDSIYIYVYTYMMYIHIEFWPGICNSWSWCHLDLKKFWNLDSIFHSTQIYIAKTPPP